MRILLVEDDVALSSSIAQAIRESGFAVDVARSGTDGLASALDFDYALVILDLLLPGKHGLAVLKELRAVKPRMPVLILSALDDVDERVDGLDRGADDYLAKPFALAELLARVRSLLRRSTLKSPDGQVHAGDLVVDLARRRVRRGARDLELTAREFVSAYYSSSAPFLWNTCLGREGEAGLMKTTVDSRVWRIDRSAFFVARTNFRLARTMVEA